MNIRESRINNANEQNIMQICSILNSCVVKSKLFKNEYVVLFIFNFVHGKLSLTCPYVKAC